MPPLSPLPLPAGWPDAETYVDSLLDFVTSSEILRNLCGGVHILDFLTREPDLYSTVLPKEWRAWFDCFEIEDILDLLMREDLEPLMRDASSEDSPPLEAGVHNESQRRWRNGSLPPLSLVEYIQNVRRYSLVRNFKPPEALNGKLQDIPRTIAVGMKPKKAHEVKNFAHYVDRLSSDISEQIGRPITHIVDFGSGQNYLGRTLASKPYNKHVVAVERRHGDVSASRWMDMAAKLKSKPKNLINKKEYRLRLQEAAASTDKRIWLQEAKSESLKTPAEPLPITQSETTTVTAEVEVTEGSRGSVQYFEHEIKDGDIGHIIGQIIKDPPAELNGALANGDASNTNDEQLSSENTSVFPSSQNEHSTSQTEQEAAAKVPDRSLMVVSLHSCGNLLHHGIRSLILNPSVTAVAMIGCCYNLMTERLGPPSYKLPFLRSNHPRLEATSTTFDSHGFPMSRRLEAYKHGQEEGLRLNITARMMAVQAPQNWGPTDSEAFFTRHFFRAMLQRIFLDRGIVGKPRDEDDVAGGSAAGSSSPGAPLVIGSLRKACYTSFKSYVRGAVAKLRESSDRGPFIKERMDSLTDEEIEEYEVRYGDVKKKLSVAWSLMAFSAGVVESTIVVDRWLYLKEQTDVVKDCWVETVFDYGLSPRNLVVVGLKR